MKRVFLVLMLIQISMVAKSFSYKDIYIGVDTAVNCNGVKSYGSGTDSPPSENYDVASAFSYKIGYEINNFLSIEYTHYRFNNKNHYNFNEDMLGFDLFIREISFLNNLELKKLYPSFGMAFIGAYELHANLHYRFSNNIETTISYRDMSKKGMNFGGGDESIKGTYLGVRYLF